MEGALNWCTGGGCDARKPEKALMASSADSSTRSKRVSLLVRLANRKRR